MALKIAGETESTQNCAAHKVSAVRRQVFWVRLLFVGCLAVVMRLFLCPTNILCSLRKAPNIPSPKGVECRPGVRSLNSVSDFLCPAVTAPLREFKLINDSDPKNALSKTITSVRAVVDLSNTDILAVMQGLKKPNNSRHHVARSAQIISFTQMCFTCRTAACKKIQKRR